MTSMFFFHDSNQTHEREHLHEGVHNGIFGVGLMTLMEWVVATPIQVFLSF
jgi:ABC-type phosphate transport system permease subunit